MKRIIVACLLLLAFVSVEAKGTKRATRPLLEIGPKASLYLGEDIQFGMGAEVIANPLRNFGVRFDITEIRFGNATQFYLNYGSSIDALIYIPMRGIDPYVHAGVGFMFVDNPGPGSPSTLFSLRFGMGFLYALNPKTNLMIEPGILIIDAGETDAVFRLSCGGRFNVL